MVCAPASVSTVVEPRHARGVDDVDDAGIADRDVELPARRVEEHDIRRAARTFQIAQDLAACRIESDQPGVVAGAEQATGLEVDVEPVRAGRRELCTLPRSLTGLFASTMTISVGSAMLT